MATRKRRRPSQKEPVGRTKSEILLFISDNPKASLTDIRSNLKTSFNIRNPKTIRKHLSDLSNDNLIQRVKVGRGLSDEYFLNESFDSLRNSFNYLKERGFALQFLKSQYFTKFIESDYMFVAIVYNVLHYMYTGILELLLEDTKYQSLLDEAQVSGELNLIEQLKETRKELFEPYNIGSLTDLKNKSPDSFISFISTEEDSLFTKQSVINILDSFIPAIQKRQLLTILKTSPSALDFVLNPKFKRPEILFGVAVQFFLSAVVKNPNKLVKLAALGQDKSLAEKDKIGILKEIVDFSDVITDNPVVTILKSLMIADELNGSIIENDDSSKILGEVFLPEAKK
jgi:DNA-binding HxlR family transcriptional regulator